MDGKNNAEARTHGKREYRSPLLREFGSVAALTQSGTSGFAEPGPPICPSPFPIFQAEVCNNTMA
jgi:hypothetical protein